MTKKIKAVKIEAVKVPEWGDHSEQSCEIGKHEWSVVRLMQLTKDFPVMEIPLIHMNLDCIYVNLNLRYFVMHMNAVLKTDMQYPIILDEDGIIMDGRHRVMRALMEGHKRIKAVRFEENPSPCKYL